MDCGALETKKKSSGPVSKGRSAPELLHRIRRHLPEAAWRGDWRLQRWRWQRCLFQPETHRALGPHQMPEWIRITNYLSRSNEPWKPEALRPWNQRRYWHERLDSTPSLMEITRPTTRKLHMKIRYLVLLLF